MAYTVEAGDKVQIEYENEDGERKETHGVVDVNKANLPEDHWASGDSVRIKRGQGRTAHKIMLYADGTLRAQPWYNANGVGEDGVIKSMEMVNDD